MSEKNSYMVFSGTATKYLAEKICQSLGCPLGQLLITKFSDGESISSAGYNARPSGDGLKTLMQYMMKLVTDN